MEHSPHINYLFFYLNTDSFMLYVVIIQNMLRYRLYSGFLMVRLRFNILNEHLTEMLCVPLITSHQ